MNVSPVSFGRAIKVNSSLQGTQRAVELINSKQIHRGEARVQQKLKDVFFDAGRAGLAPRVVSLEGKNYIFSGQEGVEEKHLRQDRDFQLAAAKKKLGEGSAYQLVKECEDARYLDLTKCLIEPIELDMNYQEKKHKIKSVNVII